MKITVSKNLDAIKEAAIQQLDGIFYRNLPKDIKANLYAAKEAEARRLILTEDPIIEGVDPEIYPFIAGEAALKGVSAHELARDILAKAHKSRADFAAVELRRQEMQERIRSAYSPAGIEAVLKEAEGERQAARPVIAGASYRQIES